MAKATKCPNCGASQAEKIGENEYKCDFCDTNFHFENKNFSSDIFNALKNVNRVQYQTPIPGLRILKLLPIIIFLFVSSISLIIFFSVREAVNTTIEQANSSMPKDDYWGSTSINKFHVFSDGKSAVIWQILNQSSKNLDSSRYSIRIVNPYNGKILFDQKYLTITWDESFNIRNYLDEIVSENGNVYFTSKENGISIYDLKSGKLKLKSDEFAQQFPELKQGIISSNWQSYRNAIELITSDGFKYYYFPKWEFLLNEKQFNDYSSTRKSVYSFTISEGDRPELFYVKSKQDTLRENNSVPNHYLEQAIKGKYNHYGIEQMHRLPEEKIFFNAKLVSQNKNEIIFIYTENLSKTSAGFIVKYVFENEIKLAWETPLTSFEGLSKVVQEDTYIQSLLNKKEVIIWYRNAKTYAVGIDQNTGKTTWIYSN